MILKFSKFFLMTLFFTNLILFFPKILQKEILNGQVSKQTFSAEMTQSFVRGLTEKGFPLRHFPEVYHPLPVAWAEEFPLYTGTIAVLKKILPVNLIVLGRFFSFIGFLFLLAGTFQLGKMFFKQKEAPWICLCVASSFPVFRIYAISFMPDIWMIACCLWAWIFALKRKWIYSSLFGALACLFKYYAFFVVLGIFLYRCWMSRSLVKSAFWLLLTSGLSVLYVVYFLYFKIPNPITEYSQWNPEGHIGLAMLAQLSFYGRWITWNFIKNPGILFGILSIFGGLFYFSKKFNQEKINSESVFFITQILCNILFSLLFSPAFYVHDYYGLQWALISLFFSIFLLMRLKKWKYPILLIQFFIGIIMTQSATFPQSYYQVATDSLKKYTKLDEHGVFITERYGEVSLFTADRSAWLMRMSQWDNIKKNSNAKINSHLLNAVSRTDAHWLSLLLVGDDAAQRASKLKEELSLYGWTNEIDQVESVPKNRKDAKGIFVLLRRNSL